MTKTPVKRKVKKTIVTKKPKLGSKEAVLKKSEDIDLDTSAHWMQKISNGNAREYGPAFG